MPQGQISLAHWRNIKHSLTVAPSLAKAAILRGVHLAGMLAGYLTSHEKRKSLHGELWLVYSSSSAGLKENKCLTSGCARHNILGHVADYDLEMHGVMSDLQTKCPSLTYIARSKSVLSLGEL